MPDITMDAKERNYTTTNLDYEEKIWERKWKVGEKVRFITGGVEKKNLSLTRLTNKTIAVEGKASDSYTVDLLKWVYLCTVIEVNDKGNIIVVELNQRDDPLSGKREKFYKSEEEFAVVCPQILTWLQTSNGDTRQFHTYAVYSKDLDFTYVLGYVGKWEYIDAPSN